GLDPDSFINKFGADRFKNLIRKSISGLKFLIDTELKERRTEVPEEKARIARNIVNEIEKMPDPVVRSEYLKQTSEYLSIDEGVLRLMPKSKSTEKKDEEKDIFLPAEKILLQMLFEDSLVASEVLKKIEDKDFKGLKSEPIFKTLSEYVENGKTPKLHEFREKIDRFLFSSLSKILQEKGEPPSMEKAHDCLGTLKRLALENRWKELNIQIARLERKGEKEKLPTLLSQRFEITKQLSVLLQRNY
ncbi:MAG: DNA primase, partial [Candidatus Aminicenantes bacterium]